MDPSTPHDPRTANRVGATIHEKYTLVRVIGTGGMGSVYEAVHVYTQRRVALKLMRNDHLLPDFVERFLREAQAPGSIGHPGIVEVLDAGQDEDGSPYLALELLEGKDLHDALEARTVDPLALCEIVMQVLDALAAAHLRGFVHRDIKPENVFLTFDHEDAPARARLLDFGIAKRLDTAGGTNVTHTGAVLGTPDFMSPEQARGEPVDARADLWATGVMLFQGLTGRRPFAGGNYNAVLAAILTSSAPAVRTIRPELPGVLARVVDRALGPRIEERYQTAIQMIAALREAVSVLRSRGWKFQGADASSPRGPETLRAWAGVPTMESLPAAKPDPPRARRAHVGVGAAGVGIACALGVAALWVGAHSRVVHDGAPVGLGAPRAVATTHASFAAPLPLPFAPPLEAPPPVARVVVAPPHAHHHGAPDVARSHAAAVESPVASQTVVHAPSPPATASTHAASPPPIADTL